MNVQVHVDRVTGLPPGGEARLTERLGSAIERELGESRDARGDDAAGYALAVRRGVQATLGGGGRRPGTEGRR